MRRLVTSRLTWIYTVYIGICLSDMAGMVNTSKVTKVKECISLKKRLYSYRNEFLVYQYKFTIEGK